MYIQSLYSVKTPSSVACAWFLCLRSYATALMDDRHVCLEEHNIEFSCPAASARHCMEFGNACTDSDTL